MNESRSVTDISIDLYKEDYTDYGWQVICDGLGVNSDNDSVTIYIITGAIHSRKK
jgi:hypothetical protein